jgi:hypothetical protein
LCLFFDSLETLVLPFSELFFLVLDNSRSFGQGGFFLAFQRMELFMVASVQVFNLVSQGFGLEGGLVDLVVGVGEGSLKGFDVLVRGGGVRIPFLRTAREGLGELLEVVRQKRWSWYGGHAGRHPTPREKAT